MKNWDKIISYEMNGDLCTYNLSGYRKSITITGQLSEENILTQIGTDADVTITTDEYKNYWAQFLFKQPYDNDKVRVYSDIEAFTVTARHFVYNEMTTEQIAALRQDTENIDFDETITSKNAMVEEIIEKYGFDIARMIGVDLFTLPCSQIIVRFP